VKAEIKPQAIGETEDDIVLTKEEDWTVLALTRIGFV
jgi:hypothetical protein